MNMIDKIWDIIGKKDNYFIKLFKEAFNIDNRNDFKSLFRKNQIKFKIAMLFIVAVSASLVLVFGNYSEKDEIRNMLSFVINIYSILIGFTVTALVFLISDFTRFKVTKLKGYDEGVKIKICKQLSSSILCSIYINFGVIAIAFINNYIVYYLDLTFLKYISVIINFTYILPILSVIILSFLMIVRILFFIKKYIDYILD